MLPVLVAHDGKLHEVLGGAIHVGPHIQHNRLTRQRREARRDGRTFNAFGQAEDKKGSHHARAGIAGTHDRAGIAGFDQFRRNPDG